MTSTLRVLLLSQAEGPDSPSVGATEPQLSAASATSNRANPDYHPAGAFLTGGPLYPGAFASVGLGVDHAR